MWERCAAASSGRWCQGLVLTGQRQGISMDKGMGRKIGAEGLEMTWLATGGFVEWIIHEHPYFT